MVNEHVPLHECKGCVGHALVSPVHPIGNETLHLVFVIPIAPNYALVASLACLFDDILSC